MIDSISRKKLCHVVENITDFDFRTPDALQLKQEIRQWYYGGRDGVEGDKLAKRFNEFFYSNMILDASGDLLWALTEQSPLEPGASLNRAMSMIPRRQIIGRSVRAYGVTAGGIQYQFGKWQADAGRCIDNALDKIDQQLQQEHLWRRENRMSLPSALISLAGIVALVLGVRFLIPAGKILVAKRNFYDIVALYPFSQKWTSSTSLILLALFTLATGNLLFLLPRMFMTLCAGLFWIFYHKARYRLRHKRLQQFRKAMKEEGLSDYCEKLRATAQQLAELPPDAPQNRDPSCALLGRAGMDAVFQTFSLKPISRGWSCKKFYKKVEKRHVNSPTWIVVLCAAIILLRGMLLTGSLTVYLQGLL